MTNEELLSVAEIVERDTNRLHRQAAEHEAKMVEHRAAFGVRTTADAKIIAGLRGERNWLRAEVAELKTQLERLKSHSRAPKYKVGDKLESYNRSLGLAIPVTVVGVRTVYDCQPDGAEYPVGHSEVELNERYAQTHCEPCDPPAETCADPDLTQLHAKGKEAWSDVPNATQWVEELRGNTEVTHDTPEGKDVAESVIRDDRNTEPKPGDTVRLMRTPTHRDYPATWEGRWGLVGREAVVVNMSSRGASRLVGVTFADGRFLEWPVSCVEVVRTEPDEIKVGDVVEVFQSTASCTFKTDIGTRGTVLQLDDSCVDTAPLDGFLAPKGNHVALCDVRKVTT